jgi:hypothetical protein
MSLSVLGSSVLGLILSAGILRAAADGNATGQDTSAAPAASTDTPEQQGPGRVSVKITFGDSGEVKDCQVVRSNAPYSLEVSTIDYIKDNWIWTFCADKTVVVPVVFDDSTKSVHWNGDLDTPPDFLPVGETQRDVKLRLTFGDDGWIKETKVIQSSGIELMDQELSLWIRVHWHHDAYAGQVIDAPFQFSRAASTPIAAQEAPAPPPTPAAPPPPPKAPEVPPIQKLWPSSNGSMPDFP